MKFFKERNKRQEVVQFNIIVGENYIQSCTEIMQLIQNGSWKGDTELSISFQDELLEDIDDCIESHHSSDRVLYSEEMQVLDIVGESFRSKELKNLFDRVEDNWLSGFLLPEPLNPHDPNAVGLMIISPTIDNPNKATIAVLGGFEVIHGGYLKREQAEKVSRKIINLMENDLYIPVLLKLLGGSPDKPNIGIRARAKTEAVTF